MEDVNIGGLFFRPALERLNVVVLRVPAARWNLLVLLKRLDVPDGQHVHEGTDRMARTGENVAHTSVETDAPKSTVNVSAANSVTLDP